MVLYIPPKLSSKIVSSHNMTQNLLISTIFIAMANLPNGDLVPNLKRGFELFNNTDLPEDLRSSCLALVAQQEVRSNLSLSSANPSQKKKHFLAQVAYIQCLHGASKPEKHRIMGQFTQSYYESKNNLDSSLSVTTIPKEVITRLPLIFYLPVNSHVLIDKATLTEVSTPA
jgi:hypothetical protein